MKTHKECDVIPLFPDQEDAPEVAGWDPYIFSIIETQQRTYPEERRRMPRPADNVEKLSRQAADDRKED